MRASQTYPSLRGGPRVKLRPPVDCQCFRDYLKTHLTSTALRALSHSGKTGEVRPEDFDMVYQDGKRFRFMSNGFTEYELDKRMILRCTWRAIFACH
jgi:hypothetical protein